jgi:hypothetical protein
MKRVRFLLVLMLALVPALSLGFKLQTDRDVGVDLLNFTTYAWQDGARVSNDALHDLIVRTIDGELGRKYLRRIEMNPDLYLTYHASHQELTIDTRQWGYSFGLRWQWGGGMGKSTTTVQSYPKGTLVIDLWAAKTQKLVWRGAASGTLGDAAKNAEKAQKAIQDIFLSYPPQAQQRR